MMKTLIFISAFLFFNYGFSQEQKPLPEGWDLITLEGKPAYMNLITGEPTYNRPTKPASKPKIAKEVDPTIFHKVKQGETLFAIAKKHNISVDEIYRRNTTLTPTNLKVGQEIVVGYDKAKEGLIIYEVNEDLYTNPSNNNQHFVKKGETLYSIARKHGITVHKLKELNNLTSNTLEIGQKIILKK